MRVALGGTVGMAAAMGIGRFVYTPLLPAMMDEIGLSPSNAGLIASANFLGYLVGAILASGGWGAGRERFMVLASLIASAVLCAAMAMTSDVTVFLAIRFLAGIVSAFIMVFLSTIVFGHLAELGRSGLQSLHFSGVGVGIAISAILSGGLILAGASWHVGWTASAALSFAAAGIVAWLIRVGAVASSHGRPEPGLQLNPAMKRLIWSYGLFGFGYVVTATFLVAIVRLGDGGPLFEPVVWLVTGLAIPPSTWLWSRLARRIGLPGTIAIGCAVEAIGVMASVTVGGYAGPLAAALLLGGTFVAITGLGLQMAREFSPASPRRSLAIMTAAFGTGQVLGPSVAGYLADFSGNYFSASALASSMLLISAALAWDAGRLSRRR